MNLFASPNLAFSQGEPEVPIPLFHRPILDLLVSGVGTMKASLGGSAVKNLPTSVGDSGEVGSIPGWGRPPGGGNGNPLQDSCLKNPLDGEAWCATVHGAVRVGHD